MYRGHDIALWLPTWLVLGLPLVAFAETTGTKSQATVVGPSNNVQIWTTPYHGPQTLLVGDLGFCAASCTIVTCGDSRPVLTGCTGGEPFVVPPGSLNFDTLTLGQITATEHEQSIWQRWLWIAAIPISALLGLGWRRLRAKRPK
jgi:hypothetical protein